jgi:hypothetical protein
MSEYTTGKQINATFCPECSDLIYHDPEVIPTEVWCPNQEKFVAIPIPDPSRTPHYVIETKNNVFRLSADGVNPINIHEARENKR